MPIGRPATVNTLWVPGGISATGATTYLCMARGLSHILTPSPLVEHRGAIAFYSSNKAHPTRLETRSTICCRTRAPARRRIRNAPSPRPSDFDRRLVRCDPGHRGQIRAFPTGYLELCWARTRHHVADIHRRARLGPQPETAGECYPFRARTETACGAQLRHGEIRHNLAVRRCLQRPA